MSNKSIALGLILMCVNGPLMSILYKAAPRPKALRAAVMLSMEE